MQADYICKKAYETVKLYGSDPFKAVIQAGAALSFKDLGSLKGAYFGNMKKPAVVISRDIDDNLQKTVCAHELGHHILHKGQMLSCENASFEEASILEREANIFAACFLIDKVQAMELLSEGYSVKQTAAKLETDENLLLFLLNTLELTEAPESLFLR